ncbi:MAG TPA: hypothetical protein PK605_02625 [Ignavibacteria bacterium]|nr:hypothetical protein [Ignavibacteria bacterium]HRF65827.1 hypothetical protein [Ignavibacteria bacterium]HRJ03277.1 hypothetical protein [Ignavibacteria bacterium]
MKLFNHKFILTATLTFIPYTALWFLWHNNLFPNIYYSSPGVNSIVTQNIWAMNFANALLVYGFVYFYWRMEKPDTRLIQPLMWGIYYNLSVVGFFSFMIFGITTHWDLLFIMMDILWCIFGGAIMGTMAFYLKKRIS